MSTQAYVWEKLFVAIDRMCGDGNFITRLEDATLSALDRLEESDLGGELGADLAYILKWTKHNMRDGRLITVPDELTRKNIISKILHVMLNTHGK
jgi:hypothetical protein